MNTESPAIPNSTDLVLQLAGGDRNGQLLPVSTAKCLLSSLIADKTEAEKYRCAIFRGEKGVAFRSYSEHVLVNGTKTSVQWLKEGDTIQLTPEMKVIVKQLGTFGPTKAANASAAPLPAVRQDVNTIAMPAVTVGSEAPVNMQPSQAPVVSTENQNVGQRMNELSDQLTSLAGSASGSETAMASLTNQPVSESSAGEPLSDKKMADASSSIQDYLDNALASTGADAIALPNQPPSTPSTPAVASNAPVDPATAKAELRYSEATLDMSAITQDSPATSAAENAAKLRKEEMTSDLNRLLSEADQNAVGPNRLAQSNPITAEEQFSTVTRPSAIKTVEATVPVPSQKAQSVEFLKTLGIDPNELGTSNKTQVQESTAPELTQPIPDVTPQDAASAALPTADEIIASASMGSTVPADSNSMVPAEVVAEEETPEPVAAPQKAESVADVLARMQNAGSLDSFSMDGPSKDTSPEPVASEAAAIATPKPQVSETIVIDESTKSESGSDEDNSVEDYMSQLLNRMRGGEDTKEPEAEEANVEKPAAKEEAAVTPEIVENSVAQPPQKPQKPLTSEQFVPKQRAVRMESFDSLREIANNSNRLAIQDHLANQRKVSTHTKLQLALISLGFGVLFFVMACMFSTHISIGGMFCGVVFLTCGIGFAKLYLDERQLDESIIKAQSAKE